MTIEPENKPSAFSIMNLLSGALISVLILIGIALVTPEFMGASHRSPVARVKSDMRSMAIAIESYLVDNNIYPVCSYDPAQKIMGFKPDRVPTFIQGMNLSTPVAYISRHPIDIFNKSGTGKQTFAYWVGLSRWMLISPGPDEFFDTDFARFERHATTIKTRDNGTTFMLMDDPDYANTYILLNSYDSTNGAKSAGDLYHVSSGGF